MFPSYQDENELNDPSTKSIVVTYLWGKRFEHPEANRLRRESVSDIAAERVVCGRAKRLTMQLGKPLVRPVRLEQL